jgi:hypothetical protein
MHVECRGWWKMFFGNETWRCLVILVCQGTTTTVVWITTYVLIVEWKTLRGKQHIIYYYAERAGRMNHTARSIFWNRGKKPCHVHTVGKHSDKTPSTKQPNTQNGSLFGWGGGPGLRGGRMGQAWFIFCHFTLNLSAHMARFPLPWNRVPLSMTEYENQKLLTYLGLGLAWLYQVLSRPYFSASYRGNFFD